jgi:ribonuclease HII
LLYNNQLNSTQMLQNRLHPNILFEAGVDEAGAGCFAGAVVAAAVILPIDFYHPDLNDSKKVSAKKRDSLFDVIKKEAIAYSIQEVDQRKVDEINILQARFLAMDMCIKALKPTIEHVLIDGDKYYKTYDLPFTCVVKGDAKYTNIAAASILAKVHRDEMMQRLHLEYPQYGWDSNMGYGTASHSKAILEHGITPYHRLTFLKKLLAKNEF